MTPAEYVFKFFKLKWKHLFWNILHNKKKKLVRPHDWWIKIVQLCLHIPCAAENVQRMVPVLCHFKWTNLKSIFNIHTHCPLGNCWEVFKLFGRNPSHTLASEGLPQPSMPRTFIFLHHLHSESSSATFKLDTVLAKLHFAGDRIICLYYIGTHILLVLCY